MEKEAKEQDLEGICEASGIWETSESHLRGILEASGKHLGGIWEAPRNSSRPKGSRRLQITKIDAPLS